GTIGGNRGIRPQTVPLEDIITSVREQLFVLLEEDVDGILFETYYDLEELETVLKIARKETDLPIITHVTLQEIGILQDRTPLNEAFERLESLGADVVGLNCRLGPHHMLKSLEQVNIPKKAYLSAYPNAGFPLFKDGKIQFEKNAEYFRDTAQAFRKQGVR